MFSSHQLAFTLSAVLLGAAALTADASPTNTYQPELDTKQQQPHTTDEISNEPKAEGAKNSPYNKRNAERDNSDTLEFQRDKAKCLTLAEQAKDQCLMELQKTHNETKRK